MLTSSKKNAKKKKTGNEEKTDAQPKKLKAKSVFASRRAKTYSPRTAPILMPAAITNAMPPVAGGQVNLLSRETLFAEGAKLEVPLWDNAAEIPTTFDILVIYINNVPRDPILLEGPIESRYTWPYGVVIPENELGAAGVKTVRYEVTYATAGMDSSATGLQFTVVRTDPNANVAPAQIMLPTWVTSNNNTISREGLSANGNMVNMVFTPPIDRNIGDVCDFFLDYFDAKPFKSAPISISGSVDMFITTAELEVRGGGNYYFTYAYGNRAGFTSPKATLLPVRVSLVPAPGALQDPIVSADPLTRKHAQEDNATITVRSYNNAQVDDVIQMLFNGRLITHELKDTVFDKVVPIPWEVLIFGGDAVPYTANVRYRIVRDNIPTPYSNTVSVGVDLTSAGGDPGGPGPVNDNLDPLKLESSQGEIDEIIDPDNVGEDATLKFNTYSNVALGHRVQVYYDGAPVLTPAYTVVQEDIDRGSFEFTLLWSLIDAGKNGDKTVFYELNNGSNDTIIRSPATTVKVALFSIEDLIRINFTESVPLGPYRSISCLQKPQTGIQLDLKDPVNIKAGDKIRIHWQGYGPDDYFSTTPLPETVGDFDIDVTADHSNPGHPGETFRVPFSTYIQPVRKGSIEVYYELFKPDGITKGESDVSHCLLTRYQGDSTLCGPVLWKDDLEKGAGKAKKKRT